MKTAVLLILALLIILPLGCSWLGKRSLFYPSHRPVQGGLPPWRLHDQVIGYVRSSEALRPVWLMLHGNAGQASDRTYALPCFDPEDSVYIMEYPGYGQRPGKLSAKAFNQAAEEAYRLLRESFPDRPVCVVGESIGSGPASHLGSLESPPDKMVLIVPYDRLSMVARHHAPSLVVKMLLRDDWDNVSALRNYQGPIDIFAASDDRIIPLARAKALAQALPNSNLIVFQGGHNDWSQNADVRIHYP